MTCATGLGAQAVSRIMPPTLRLTNQVLFFMFLVLLLIPLVSCRADCALVSVQRDQGHISLKRSNVIDIHQNQKPTRLIARQDWL